MVKSFENAHFTDEGRPDWVILAFGVEQFESDCIAGVMVMSTDEA
jgi:hypothetical protein